MKKIIVGVTGASGSVYADRLIRALLFSGHEVHLVATVHGESVCAFELDKAFQELVQGYRLLSGNFHLHLNTNLFSQIASGSAVMDAMVVVPCSMGTLSKIRYGTSDSLLTRAADVMIKENRRLVIVPRETPLSPIHLENMLSLSRLGVVILPVIPAFYLKPQTLDEMIGHSVDRILQTIGVENPNRRVWEGIE